MIFNSVDFLLFYLLVFALYFSMPSRFRWGLLLVASYFFYMYWEAAYILLILASTLIDYFVSHRILSSDDPKRRKQGLWLSIAVNLGLLFTFKYFNFFQENLSLVFDQLGVNYVPNQHELILPVGISFYTFQTLSYTIDVYRRKIPPEKHLGIFALYVSFFPQLVAGPIERATNLLPQLRLNTNRFNSKQFISGFVQACWGFFKKAVVADIIAIQVDAIFNNYEMQSSPMLLMGIYLFAFQIYNDFSGYSDIAIGVSRMMGYDLMENFRLPYFSKNVTEFWRRWHISLSSWLRDYLYIPLGGNRKGKKRTYANLGLTMLLGGLWHGAAWNFVIWGGLNGAYLAVERGLGIHRKSQDEPRKSPFFLRVVQVLLCFNLICLTWIFFRAETLEQALFMIKGVVQWSGNLDVVNSSVFANILLVLPLLLAVEYFFLRKHGIRQLSRRLGDLGSAGFCSFLILIILLFGISNGSQFIYFQF